MYQPAHFIETRPEVLHALVRSHPLATLVTLSAKGLDANHIPLVLRASADGRTSLVGHVARANPVWKDTDLSIPVLAIFQGPQHYISPGWYATKAEHGKVVPTWNYVVAHAHGTARVMQEPDWMLDMLNRLTDSQESRQASPWRVGDAPSGYIEKLARGIVGIEIPIDRLEGKLKASQDEATPDRYGTVKGLQSNNSNQSRAMAELVRSALAGEAPKA